ncbi:MAG: hypothetical protein HUU35_03870 [Armatimonadetes bacterium]|nr:hypothetical protein [Armatimonadota bacterium]
MRFLGLLLLGVVSSGWAEPLALRLTFKPAACWEFRESLRGSGELTRHLASGDQVVRLDATAINRRAWRVESAEGELVTLTAVSAPTETKLVLPDATFEDKRPWRAFRLAVTADGALQSAEVLPAEEGDASAEPEEVTPLPLDLDLGEVFAMLELGMLPPKALEPGESWEVARDGAGQAAVSGRLIEVLGEAAEQLAVLETRYQAPVPEMTTPAAGVVVSGSLSGLAQVRFEVAAGRVRSARGPLDLRLQFRRRGNEAILATVNLRLELDVAAVDQPAPRG